MKSLSVVQTETNHRADLIHQAVSYYQTKLANHPIRPFCEKGLLSRSLVEDFARIQYVDSTLWVAMLSLARGRVSNPKLSEAIRKNIFVRWELRRPACYPRAGVCQKPRNSSGVRRLPGLCSSHRTFRKSHECFRSGRETGSFRVGSGRQTLVPTLFSMFRPAFQHHAGADLRYLDEHITIDADEHAQWMLEAAVEVSETEAGFKEIIHGSTRRSSDSKRARCSLCKGDTSSTSENGGSHVEIRAKKLIFTVIRRRTKPTLFPGPISRALYL